MAFSSKTFVPKSNDEVFEHYFDFMKRTVYKHGITYENSEDVAMNIFVKFIENDVLSDFQVGYKTHHGGVERTTSFRNFLAGFVITYVKHYYKRQQIHATREGTSIDHENKMEGVSWFDTYGPVFNEEYDDLHVSDLVKSIRKRLEEGHTEKGPARCDLPALFDQMLTQIDESGKVDVGDLADHFGVSTTSIQNWLRRLRKEVLIVTEEM